MTTKPRLEPASEPTSVPRLPATVSLGLALGAMVVALSGCSGSNDKAGGDIAEATGTASKVAPAAAAEISGGPITVPIEGTSVELRMIPINGGAGGGFYACSTEVTWDLYDAFIFNLDTDAGKSTTASDAVTRPSKPYVLVDRGYGHAGYAALSISPKAAVQLAEWLSIKTGRSFRIPTEAELTHLIDTSGVKGAEARLEHGWFAENSDYSTHEVGSLPPDSNGLHDVWGNVSEYAITPDGEYVVMGGSFIDDVADVDRSLRIPFTPEWNADDPQIPKSPWWLASNDWVGVRMVCDP